MKVAITGEGGFLGYHLTQYYKKKGWEVVKLGRSFAKNLDRAKDCDFIIHAAGVNRAATDQEVYDANVELALILVNRLRELGMKMNIKFISSVQETNGSAYGNAKAISRTIVELYCEESNTTFESYALPNLYGTHGKPNYNSFVNTFAYNIVNKVECNYNKNKVLLCWVYDAIAKIDNQVEFYNTIETTPWQVYFLLKGMSETPYEGKDKLMLNLQEILNHYKQTMKILVLGHTGMLGHMVKRYFEKQNFKVLHLQTRFGTKYFEESVKSFDGDFIINCIGAIPQRTNDFKINTDLPIWLSNNAPCKVIHPATDCEMDADAYGTSKRLANEYIKLYSSNTKMLKTSIIGPENGTHFGLMEWFLAQEGEVNGWTQAIWNGNTTLEWAKQCHTLMEYWNMYNRETILEGKPISKFDMLNLFNTFYNKNVTINPINMGKNKCLHFGEVKTSSLEEQLEELKEFLKL